MLSNLKAALAARGMRQADLAAALRMHASALSEIVCGRRTASADLRKKIAALLEVDEGWAFQQVRPRPVQGNGGQGVHAPAQQGGDR